jgi:hypothetical protein
LVFSDGGQMIATLYENYCTGEIYEKCKNTQDLCFPNSDSDVPGPPCLLCSRAYFIENSGYVKTTFQ